MTYDLIVRGGTVVDGLGGEPYRADVAISAGSIAAIGSVDGPGEREIDATGLVVTPGFVDLHTHYDGQAIWSDRMTPSSAHGVTTAVMGNCGVGFAPCRPEDHDTLVDVMAGVEDIPGVVMVDGLPWTWETFPEFLDALDSRPRDIDVAAFLPHSPLRVYVMGQRGVDREPPTAEDLAMMRKLAAEAVQAGAVGFASSRLTLHKTAGGQPIPSYEAQHAEIEAIARGVDDAGGGLLQFVPDLMAGDYEGALKAVFDVAAEVGLPVTFTLAIGNAGPPLHLDAMRMVENANKQGGDVTGQIFPRPIGLVLGLAAEAEIDAGRQAGLFQRLPQGKRDRLCLLGRRGQFGGGNARQTAVLRVERGPFARKLGGRERVGDGPAPRGRGIMPPAVAPGREFAAVHPHPLEQQLQVELRMCLDRPAAESGDRIGLMRSQCLPFLLVHAGREIGQHHHAVRQSGHAPQQCRHRRR